MPRRRTYRRHCTNKTCPAVSDVEYTSAAERQSISATWTCTKHAKPDEYLTPQNTETHTVLELHPKYTQPSRYANDWDREPRLLGNFWGPEGQPDQAHHGIVSGPGFHAAASEFPPGTRLIVTTRIELPTDPAQDRP